MGALDIIAELLNHRSQAHPYARRSQKPDGQPTRGKTAANRLRRIDTLISLYDTPLLTRGDGLYARAYFVDLGYGATPVTTLESALHFRRINPRLPVLGVEIDPQRVAAAQYAAGAGIAFRLGGFNLPLTTWPDGAREHVRLIRVFNVLRQYDEQAWMPAYARLAEHVLPQGLLIEGTSNPEGSLWVANVARRTVNGPNPWQTEALVFGHNLRQAFDPAAHQAVLPKRLIHRMVSGEPIADFMAAWKRAAGETAAYRVWGPRAWWTAAARRLRGLGYRVDTRDRWLGRGYLVWLNPEL